MTCPKCGSKKAETLTLGGVVFECGSETDKRGKLYVALNCYETLIEELKSKLNLITDAADKLADESIPNGGSHINYMNARGVRKHGGAR